MSVVEQSECISGLWKLERWEKCVSKILAKFGTKHISLDSAQFDVLEKLAILNEAEEVINRRLTFEKNLTVRNRFLMLILDIKNRRPIMIGSLRKERLLELSDGHNGERLVKKSNLIKLLKKWYPLAFIPIQNHYSKSVLRILGFPSVPEFVFQKQRYTEDSIFGFLCIGIAVGYIIGQS